MRKITFFTLFTLFIILSLSGFSSAEEYASTDWVYVTGIPLFAGDFTIEYDGESRSISYGGGVIMNGLAEIIAEQASEMSSLDAVYEIATDDTNARFRFIASTPGELENGKVVRLIGTDVGLDAGTSFFDKTEVTMQGGEGGEENDLDPKESCPEDFSCEDNEVCRSGVCVNEHEAGAYGNQRVDHQGLGYEYRGDTPAYTVVNHESNTAHICGDAWDVNDAIAGTVVSEGFCSVVSANNFNFTCTADENGLGWAEGSSDVQPQLTPDHEAWNHIPNPPSSTAVACEGGELVAAQLKYTAPPELLQGYCAPNGCAVLHQGEVKCVSWSYSYGSYVCTARGHWQSRLAGLSRELQELAGSNDYLLNCGPQDTVINTGAPSEYGYCQMATLNRDGSVKDTVIGVSFTGNPPSSSSLDRFSEEIRKTHPSFSEDIDSDNPIIAAPYARIKEVNVAGSPTHIGYFTNRGNLDSVSGAGFWRWFIDLFTDTTVQDLPTYTTEQFFYSNYGEEVFAAVEYDPTREDCYENNFRVISSTGQCYNERAWRSIIQNR